MPSGSALDSVEPAATGDATLSPLTARTRLGMLVAGSALALGLAGDGLMRADPGVNVALLATLLVVAIVLLAQARGTPLSVEQRLLLVPVLFFGEAFAWRDAEALLLFGFAGLLLALAALGTSLAGGWYGAAGWTGVLGAGFRGLIQSCLRALGGALGGAPGLASDVDALALARGGRVRSLGPWARGLVLAAPVLVVFTALFASADPMFERLVRSVFRVDAGELFSHVVTVAALAWLAAGYLRTSLLAPAPECAPAAPVVTIGAVELGVLLGTLNALFLAFGLVQARYLFGGSAHVLATAGLTVAEYARRGFFELVFVALLVLPLLLLSHEILRKDARSTRAFRRLAAALLLQLVVVMASAGERMRLYVGEFGLTHDRLYASAFMAWLAVVFVLFAATVLRGRGSRLGGAALVAGWATLGALGLANPDALIARVNLARVQQGHDLDGRHVAQLGADAVPTVLAALPTIPAEDRCTIARVLLGRWGGDEATDWRSWNKARSAARALVRGRRADLERMTVPRGVACPGAQGAQPNSAAPAQGPGDPQAPSGPPVPATRTP